LHEQDRPSALEHKTEGYPGGEFPLNRTTAMKTPDSAIIEAGVDLGKSSFDA
jgi:hypothetical protein